MAVDDITLPESDVCVQKPVKRSIKIIWIVEPG